MNPQLITRCSLVVSKLDGSATIINEDLAVAYYGDYQREVASGSYAAMLALQPHFDWYCPVGTLRVQIGVHTP